MAKTDNPAPELFRPPAKSATSHVAGAVAAARVGSWRERILARLDERPSTLWELAQHFETQDHRISGRLTELQRDGQIEHAGDRRPHPVSGCPAEVWRLRRAVPSSREIPQLVGAPSTVVIDGRTFDLQPLTDAETYPGLPYAARAGGQVIRVELVECPACGKPLYFKPDGELKLFVCSNGRCQRTFKIKNVAEPGKAPMPAVVMDRF